MKAIVVVLALALVAMALSVAHVLPIGSILPEILFGTAIILALLAVIGGSDQKS